MAITKEQIFAVADELDAAGQNPTLANVRKQIGSGSFTTISEAMNEWRARKASQAAPIREPAPQAITDKLAELLDVRGFNLNAGMSLRPVSKAPSIDRISSLVLRTDQPLDIDRLSEFMNELLEDHGKQLLRYKGVLNIAGEDRRMVFQGVLKLYGFDWDTEWAEGEVRESVIVFIADELPEDKIREGFAKVYQS